jgi:hypothetical protein
MQLITEMGGCVNLVQEIPSRADLVNDVNGSAYPTRCKLFVETNMGSLCGPGSRHGPASPGLIPVDSGRSPNRAQTISPLIQAIGNSATACGWLRVFVSVN